MPKKRSKKATRNAYFFYMLHFEKEEAKRKRYYPDIAEISRAASASWNVSEFFLYNAVVKVFVHCLLGK